MLFNALVSQTLPIWGLIVLVALCVIGFANLMEEK